MRIKKITILANLKSEQTSNLLTFRQYVGKVQEIRFFCTANAEISIFDKFENEVISEKIYTREQKTKKLRKNNLNFSAPTIFKVDVENTILSGIIKFTGRATAQLIAIEYD